jgi:hypothetical protein
MTVQEVLTETKERNGSQNLEAEKRRKDRDKDEKRMVAAERENSTEGKDDALSFKYVACAAHTAVSTGAAVIDHRIMRWYSIRGPPDSPARQRIDRTRLLDHHGPGHLGDRGEGALLTSIRHMSAASETS